MAEKSMTTLLQQDIVADANLRRLVLIKWSPSQATQTFGAAPDLLFFGIPETQLQ